MGKASRDKGARYEREIVNAHRAIGIDAERIPLSGAVKGSFSGDVRIAGYTAECKSRANGFKQIYDWLEHDGADVLFLRADRKPSVAVLTWDTWESLLKQAGVAK